MQLTIKDAVLTGLKNNLGIILSGQNVNQAGGQRLQQLQKLLPTVNGTFKESVQQVNLKAQGLNIPGFPSIIGPFCLYRCARQRGLDTVERAVAQQLSRVAPRL